MYCKKCAQPLVRQAEKAIGEPRDRAWQEVWMSTTTDSWICAVDGNEHEPGSLTDWALRVQETLRQVQELVQDHELLTPEQGLELILIDAGLVERSARSFEIGRLIHEGDLDALLAIIEEV